MLLGQDWDYAKASKLLAGRDAVWPLLVRAAALPAAQAPVISNLDNFLRMDNNSDETDLRPIWLLNLSIVRGWALLNAGQADAGVDALITACRFANVMEQSRGGLPSLGCRSSRWNAVCALAAMVQRPEVSATTLCCALAALGQTRPELQEFDQNLRVVLQQNLLALDVVDRGLESV